MSSVRVSDEPDGENPFDGRNWTTVELGGVCVCVCGVDILCVGVFVRLFVRVGRKLDFPHIPTLRLGF